MFTDVNKTERKKIKFIICDENNEPLIVIKTSDFDDCWFGWTEYKVTYEGVETYNNWNSFKLFFRDNADYIAGLAAIGLGDVLESSENPALKICGGLIKSGGLKMIEN